MVEIINVTIIIIDYIAALPAATAQLTHFTRPARIHHHHHIIIIIIIIIIIKRIHMRAVVCGLKCAYALHLS